MQSDLPIPGDTPMKFHQMRIIMLGTVATLSPVALLAQSTPMSSPSSPQQTQPGVQPGGIDSPAMQNSGNNASDTAQNMKDKMFLRNAAEGGMAEVKLGQLAVQKGNSDDVKAFGQKMVDDHTALNNQMAPIADSMGVRVPKELNKKDQASYDRLSSLSGDDFDKEYLTMMVKDHHKDLHDFRDEAANTTDPTLKAAVSKGQDIIREHTMMVDKLAQSKGIPVPDHRKPSTPSMP
jgi:putative membrane protein